jgi:hypothetical protein
MTEVELERLERDVEQARGRLASDVARMSGTSVLSEFGQDVISRVTRASRESAWNTAHRIVTDIKDRAAANPAAVLAIGAGLAWRLVRHPPVSSILVGLGVAGLLKTDPKGGPSPLVVRGTELTNSAEDVLHGSGDEAREWAARARHSVSGALDQFPSLASAGASRASEATTKASTLAVETSDILSRAVSQKDVRDNYLLGVAALAIGTAAVIARQRRDV